MKKLISMHFIGILALAILCSGCSTNRMAAGDPGAVLAGAAIGGNVGGAIGGLIGENNRGWRGGYRGSHRHYCGNHCRSRHCQCRHRPQTNGRIQLPGRENPAHL